MHDPLERATNWMLTTLLEVLIATQYRRNVGGGPERLSPSYIIQRSRMLESATRRYLVAIKELARVRKLQGVAPVQVNSQAAALRGSVGLLLGVSGWASRWPQADRGHRCSRFAPPVRARSDLPRSVSPVSP